jgi:hypothetical protein
LQSWSDLTVEGANLHAREEEVDPLIIEDRVDYGLEELFEFGGNEELTGPCSLLKANERNVPPPMYLPLLIRAAYVFLLRSYESREQGARHPPCDGLTDNPPTAEEWDAEIDYLRSLMDEQDKKNRFKIESLTLGDQDFVRWI